MKCLALAFVLFASQSCCSLFGLGSSGPAWNALKITWDLKPWNMWAFNSLPRHVSELSKHPGFRLRDNQCETGTKLLGQRYWYNGDPAVTLLYDVQGTIAGIQTSIPKANFTPSAALRYRKYTEDGEFWTLTAYFVDPSSICTSGRSKDKLDSEGTGAGLWLQWGPSPLQDTVKIPSTEEGLKGSSWKFGHCFRTMGKHYWYNVKRDMSCDDFIPNCIMYNKGKLTAFCFALNAGLTSPRYEHPTAEISKKFIDPVPDCFFSDPTYNTLSTIHVYFINSPRLGSLC